MILDSGLRFADSPLIRAGPCSLLGALTPLNCSVCRQPGKRFPTAWGWLILLYLTPLWTFSESEAPSSHAWSGVGVLKPVLQRCCERGYGEGGARHAITESVHTEGELIMMLIMPTMMHDVIQIRAHDDTCALQLVAVWTAPVRTQLDGQWRGGCWIIIDRPCLTPARRSQAISTDGPFCDFARPCL